MESNLLQALYRGARSAEDAVRSVVKDAFQTDIRLDYSIPHRHCLRIGADLSDIPPDPRDQLAILSKCEKLDSQGDGIRSFTATCLALVTLKRPVILIDEPEAFLHPPQALRLGEFIASQVLNGRQIIVATHSADILRGMLGRKRDLGIIRLDRTQRKSFALSLSPLEVQAIADDPLLGAARVLDGLFYGSVVVVEADSDAKFYQAVSRQGRRTGDLYFVNADNKQTVSKIISSYRKTGVRCAGIVDIDILHERAEFESIIRAFGAPDLESLLEARNEIANGIENISSREQLKTAVMRLATLSSETDQILRSNSSENEISAYSIKLSAELQRIRESASKWSDFKQRGRSSLEPSIRNKFDELCKKCAAVGLFICPFGELEAALTDYDKKWTSRKRTWLTEALILLPTLNVDNAKEPWKLILQVHQFLEENNPEQ